jgi:hypothetical protein
LAGVRHLLAGAAKKNFLCALTKKSPRRGQYMSGGHHMKLAQRFFLSLQHVVLFATLFGLLALAERAPARFEHAMREDGWAEWATFCAFALAAGLAVHALWRTRAAGRLHSMALVGLALFCLFVAGEEISWGQRLLGFRPAALFLENNHQQESNLHNLLKGIFETRWMVFLVAAAYGVVAPYLAYVTRWPRALAAPLGLIPWFAAVAFLEFSYPYDLVGELAELVLGMLFLADIMERRRRLRIDQGGYGLRRAGYACAALAVALLCLPLNDVSLRSNTAELVTHTREDLSTLAVRMQSGDVLRSGLFKKREVHKRLYTAVKAGYVDLGRERFYLDAWNSPYWLAFQRTGEGRGRVVLYSFGPNRRRDREAEADGYEVAGGDDVAVSVEVSLPAHAER